jgi:hypothetical protein
MLVATLEPSHGDRVGTQTLTQGDALDAFVDYCTEIDDLELVEALPERDEPLLALTELTDELVGRLLGDAVLRSRVGVLDLARLENVNAVRSSVFVLLRVVPSRRVRREGAARERVHAGGRRARDHLARNGLTARSPGA